MKIIHILFAAFIICAMCGFSSAGEGTSSSSISYSIAAMEYPHEGHITISADVHGGYGDASETSTVYNTLGNYVNYSYVYNTRAGGGITNIKTAMAYTDTGYEVIDRVCYLRVTTSDFETCEGESDFNTTDHKGVGAQCASSAAGATESTSMQADITLTISTNILYNISGVTGCVNSVALITNGTTLYSTTLSAEDSYLFENLIPGFDYTLKFSNDHQYNFTCADSNINYDYDACTHTQYKFKELCGNLIPDSEGLYIEKQGVLVLNIENFYESSGILDISNSSADHIYIYSNTFVGRTSWLIDPVIPDTEYTLTNPNIAWGLKVIVQNESDGTLIEDALVKVDQDCYCTAGYSTRQKMTINGMVTFGDMSLQDASLFVMKSGYKICDENTTGYNVFLSGRTNFSSKTWVVKLAPSDSENVSTFYESGNKVDIHFRDVNGNRTSQIRDTDSEVYLYYENNNTDNEAMTLKFQSSSTHTYFSDELSWTIANDDIGHKTIANSYFTPWDYSYRAVIYNSSIYGWNITRPLTVRNATKETTLHYENLTTQIFFMGASDGKIDYREDMNIAVHACSNNTTLMYVDVELYKNNSLLCYKNLTASNFINADFQYWYVWSPIYNYEAGANYSIRMFGFDRTLLETDYIECVADEITRKNKLTIIVKNRFGTNLDNAFVYLEGYGALPTGVNSYASYEGLDAGYYRYKATRAGYDAAGWDDVTLSDGDEIRTYILTEITSATGAANQPVKADDGDLRNLYIMLMSFLFIFVLFGGFLYVIK